MGRGRGQPRVESESRPVLLRVRRIASRYPVQAEIAGLLDQIEVLPRQNLEIVAVVGAMQDGIIELEQVASEIQPLFPKLLSHIAQEGRRVVGRGLKRGIAELYRLLPW